MTPLRERVIRATALNLIAVLFNQGSTLIVNVIVARILLQHAFGEYAMVQSTLLTAATLSQVATGYTAAKYIAEFRSSDPERAGRIMGLCTIVATVMAAIGAVLLIAFAPWLAVTTLKSPHLTVPLMIGAGYLFFSAVNGYQTGALAGLEAYGSLAKAGVVSGTVAICAISFGAWEGGLYGALTALSVSALLRCAVHNWFLGAETRLHNIKPLYRGSVASERSIILQFALPAAFAGYYSMPMFWLANSLLVRQPAGYAEMALYAAAVNIKGLVLFAPSVLNGVMSSILNHLKGAESGRHYERLYRYNILFTFVAALGAAVVLGGFSSSVLGMFGKSFQSARLILLIVLAASVLETTGGAIFQHIQNHGRMWLSFLFINLPVVLLFVVVAFLLVPRLGALGLAIASLCMAAAQLLATGWLASRVNSPMNNGNPMARELGEIFQA